MASSCVLNSTKPTPVERWLGPESLDAHDFIASGMAPVFVVVVGWLVLEEERKKKQ